MALVTYRPLRSFQQDINRMFEGMFGEVSPKEWEPRGWYPACDVAETDEAFLVKAELPGVTPDEVKLNMTNNVLTLYGEKQQETEDKAQNYYRIERTSGTFQRSFTFPSTVEAAKITASYKDGVLTITLPKAEEAKPRQIPISTNSN